mgnify:FL=1
MLYFIVNEKSKSGNAKQIWKEIEEVLKVRNVSYQAFVSEYRGHAGKLAAEICAMAVSYTHLTLPTICSV